MESQSQAAQRIYNDRASTYDDSWHSEYSKRMVDLIPVRPGAKVLVLCCGTGLESFVAASRVGLDGLVVGVDISPGMLAEAHARQKREPDLGSRMRFMRHDVVDLNSCAELEELGLKSGFDLLICSNAFVLLGDPNEVVARWKTWLKQGGRMVIDIPHERNLIQGLLIEKVAEDMGSSWCWNRRWVQDKASFEEILKNEGMDVEKIELLDKVLSTPVLEYDLGAADEQFEYILKSPFASNLQWTTDEVKKAKALFRKEWEGVAKDGKVEIVDALYLYIAKKP